MRPIKIISAWTFFFFAFVIDSPGAVYLPVNQTEYQFIYDLVRRAEISGQYHDYFFSVAPYDFDKINQEYPLSALTSGVDNGHISAFAFLSEDLRSAKYERGRGYESVRGGLIARPYPRLFIYTGFLLDEKMHDDPDYAGKKWRGLAGEIENSYMAYDAGSLDILLGRFSSFWGPINQSLILSETARAMDALSLRLQWKKLHFTYQFGKLSRVDTTITSGAFDNRFFAGHRIDFKPISNLRIGLFETIIFGGPGRSVDLTYLNPIMFYHAAQLNENVDDNTFLGLDFDWYIRNRHKLYGQLMVDDMQVDDEAAGDQEPDEIGWQIGFNSIDLFNRFDLSLEYLKITNRTYNQKLPRNRYENRGELIGHAFGPDGDRLQMMVTHWFGFERKISLDLSYQRRGEGRYDDTWTEPWEDYDGDYTELFPTGIVEKSLKSSLHAAGFYRNIAFINIEAGLEHVKNFKNNSGDNRTIPFVNLRVSLICHHLFNFD
ncbi:MAG: capsule assembly Wzi family protein [Candidatus Zixiibacteriota bacterium]